MAKMQLTPMTCTPHGDGWECVCQCGYVTHAKAGTAYHACETSKPRAKPGLTLTQKAANFAASAVKHVAAGMPRASDEERERRFAICQGCEFYDGKACTKCGCPVVRERQFISKLTWAGESCPVGKWGPVSS
jgi:hypothetical protein